MDFLRRYRKIIKLREVLELRTQNNIELHVEEVRKRQNQTRKWVNEYKLSDHDTRKNDIIEELKNVVYNDVEDKIFRLGLTDTEILNILDTKYIDASTKKHTLEPGIYESSDINLMLKSLLLVR